MMMVNSTSLFKEIWKGRWGYIFIAPGYLAFIAFMLAPLFLAISLSFTNATINLSARTNVGFNEYARLFKDPIFIKALVNTIKYVLVVVPTTVIISLIISFLIQSLGMKAQSFFRGAFYLPGVAGGVIISIVWLWIFNPTYGLLNYLLSLIGVEPILWLADSHFSFWAVCMVVLTFTLGQPIILFLAGLAGIPQDVTDAAIVDGANSLQLRWYVILPLLKPVLLFVVATETIGVFQIWETIFMLTMGGPSNSSTSLVFLIYQTAFIAGKYGKASAIGVVLLLIVMCVTFIQLHFWGKQ
jgi:multiple sugar transport system permease protein